MTYTVFAKIGSAQIAFGASDPGEVLDRISEMERVGALAISVRDDLRAYTPDEVRRLALEREGE